MSQEILNEVKEISGALTKAREEMTNRLKQQEEEIQKHGETTSKTAEQIQKAEENINKCCEDMKSQEERLQDVEKRLGRPSVYGGGGGNLPPGHKRCTPGEQFVMSDVFEQMQKNRTPTGERFELRSLHELETKDITSDSASAGALIDEMRLPEIFRDPADRLQHVRDLLNVGQTSSNAIEYSVDHGGFTNNAGPQSSELSAKNKSDQSFDLKTESVQTIAHYMIASRQVLEDAPMLRSYIDGRLTYGLMLEEDDQILNGDGTGGTLNGILTNPNIQDVGSPGDVQSGDTRLDHIRRAIAAGRRSNYPMNGILLNPDDWADLELTKGSDEHYIWVTVPQGGESRLWRVPVVESNAIASGDFIVGNWDLAATLWDRQQSNIRVSESHQDLFVKNGVVILAEERLALTVYRPQAFVKGQFPGLT